MSKGRYLEQWILRFIASPVKNPIGLGLGCAMSLQESFNNLYVKLFLMKINKYESRHSSICFSIPSSSYSLGSTNFSNPEVFLKYFSNSSSK